jgi:predicted CopG family antitoxin
MSQSARIVKESKGEAMQTIEVSEEVYSWLVEHKDYLESEGQQHITFDDVIRDLYEKFHQAVQELDRERPRVHE